MILNSHTITKNKSEPSTHEKGVDGENRAVEYLKKKGYKIIDRNFRIRGGEIDIIVLDGEYLVFVEVKSLPKGDVDTLSHELGGVKRHKIIKTAKCYLENHREYDGNFIRFDVIALDVPGLESIYHVCSAFSESGLC